MKTHRARTSVPETSESSSTEVLVGCGVKSKSALFDKVVEHDLAIGTASIFIDQNDVSSPGGG